MSGSLAFYLVKILAITTIALLYFVVLAFIGIGLSKLMPDDPNESIEETGMYILGYVALVTVVFYIARTQLKQVPKIFDGLYGTEFRSDMLKERDGSALSLLGLLAVSTPIMERLTRMRVHINKKL